MVKTQFFFAFCSSQNVPNHQSENGGFQIMVVPH